MYGKDKYLLSEFENTLFVFLLTQYLGALGQYYVALDNIFEQMWSLSYLFVKIILVFLIVLRCFSRKNLVVKQKNLCIFLAIFFLCIGSIYISNMNSSTLGFIGRLLMTIVIGIYFIQKCGVKKIIDMLCKAQIIYLAMLIVFMVFYAGYAFFIDSAGQQVLIGMYTTKNSCAFELVFGIILFYIRFRTYDSKHLRILHLVIIGFQLFLVIQCRSLGAILTGIISVLFAEILIKWNKNIRLDYVYLLMNGGFFVVVFLFVPACSGLLEKLGRDATLTGRTDIWMSIFQFLKKGNYLFGYGYESFWDNDSVTTALYKYYAMNGVKYNYTGAHNTMIELLLYFGIIGLLLYLVVVARLLSRVRKFKGIEGLFILSLFFFFTIHGVVERSLSDSSYDTLIFVMLLATMNKIGVSLRKEERNLIRC